MPVRKYQAGSSSYRYGFNGKEKSEEVYGDGNVYDYGFRIYNSRLCRFLSVDPLTNKYAELTPYQFSSNNPIFFIDLDGQEGDYYFKRDGNSHLVFINYIDQGKGKPNRIFVMDGLTSAGKKENRLKKDGAYWEQKITPTSMYSEENHRAKSGEDSQFDIDRRNWLWGSGSDYSDKNVWQRYKEDGNDNPDKEIAKQLILMIFTPIPVKTSIATAETPIKSTNNQAKSSTASKNTGAVEANTAPQMQLQPVQQAQANAGGFKDLVGFRKDHILNRHRSGSGIPGKTEFPASWSDQKILNAINKIANDINAPGGMGKWNSPYKTGNVDGIEIRVDFYPPNHPSHSRYVSTGYPTNVTPNQ